VLVKQLIDDLVERARVLVGAHGALIVEQRSDSSTLVLVGTGVLAGIVGSFAVQPDSPVLSTLRTGQCQVLGSIDEFGPASRQTAISLGAESAMYVPLRSGQGPFAVLAVLSNSKQAFSDRHLALVEGVAESLAALLDTQTSKELGELREHATLVESERRFRAFLAGMPALAWVKDSQRRYALVNENFARRFGRTVDECLGLRSTDLVVPGESSVVTSHDDAVYAGAVFAGEEQITAPDGTRLSLWTTRFPIAAHDLDGGNQLGGVSVDITPLKRAEEALARSDETFRALIEHLPIGVIIHRAGVLCLVNAAAAKLVGSTAVGPLLGRRVDEFLSPDQPHFALDVQRLQEERVGRSQTEIRKADGSRALLRTVTTRIDFDGGPAMAVILHDVTEEQKRQAQLQVTARLASVGTLAAAVAHEINNPLSYVLTNLHLITDDLKGLGAGAAGTLSMIDDASVGVERIRVIVKALAALARTHPATARPLNLHAQVDAALHLVGKSLRQHAQVSVELGPMPLVAADETQLTQVLVNLLTNASQAFDDAPNQAHLVIVRGFTDEAGDAVLEVQDNGVGIAPENLQRVFDPFFTTRVVGEGSGLGLSIAHSIITGLHGTITVESRPGAGATFRVVLPASAGPAVPVPTLARGKVLVVDDDALLGKVLARSLNKAHDTVVVQSADEALAALSRESFDVILTDVMMPGTDGIGLYEEILRRTPPLAPRVVFISGGTFTDAAREFLQRSTNRRLDKPLDLPEVLRVVGEVMAGRVTR
jgi:PAS domain S-box-containing protein